MKPDWKDAPDWANWLAMDEDFIWWWYAKAPVFGSESGLWDNHQNGEVEEASKVYEFEPCDTLEPRP
jgi:hypothetical protein